MYLRTTRRVNKDGSVVKYLALAHNIRSPKSSTPVATIIHNFGRADKLDYKQLDRLCRSIARVCGLKVVDPAEITSEAPELCADTSFADILKIKQTLSLGCPMVIEALWEQLGLKKTLQDIECSG